MSTEFHFPSRTSRRWLRVGPLAGDLDRFATRLKAQGYTRPSAVSKLRLVSNLNRWLEHQGLGIEALGESRIESFLLTLDDLDWDAGVVIVSGKGQRRQPLPLSREVGEALVSYLCDGRPRWSTRRVFVRIRAPHVGFAGPAAIGNVVHRALARAGIDPPFKGSHLLRHSLATAMLPLRWTFAKLSKQVGLLAPSKSHGIGPRLHDMRHRFAVNTLLRWYRDGVDVERHIPRLATWLGHAHVSDTYWYLTATPELMQLAARRLDRIARRSSP